MSVKSKNKSGRIDRPFNPDILKRAHESAEQYRIILRREDGIYFGEALELPGTMNDGKTPAECLKNTIEMIATAIATLMENGQIPPLPASDNIREEQVNVRLTKLEKMTFEEAARSRGFRGLSDFMRAATMSSVSPK